VNIPNLQDESTLRVELEESRQRIDVLARELHQVGAELEGLEVERQRYALLHDVCGGLEKLDEGEAANLFWNGLADVAAALPAELRAVGHDVRNDGQARRAAKALLEKTGAGHLLLTRGNLGMTLFDEDGREGQIPPVTNLEAADAFGAGDAAAAAFTLALSCAATMACFQAS